MSNPQCYCVEDQPPMNKPCHMLLSILAWPASIYLVNEPENRIKYTRLKI